MKLWHKEWKIKTGGLTGESCFIYFYSDSEHVQANNHSLSSPNIHTQTAVYGQWDTQPVKCVIHAPPSGPTCPHYSCCKVFRATLKPISKLVLLAFTHTHTKVSDASRREKVSIFYLIENKLLRACYTGTSSWQLFSLLSLLKKNRGSEHETT